MNEPEREPQRGQLQRLPRDFGTRVQEDDLQTLLLKVLQRLQAGESPATSNVALLAADAVAEALASAVDVHENRFGRARYRDLHWMLLYGMEPPKPALRGARVLDLGCGSINPCGFGMLVCALGATECTAIDLDDVDDVPRAVRALARLIDWLLQDPRAILRDEPVTRDDLERNLAGFDVPALRRGDPAGLGTRLRYLRRPASALGLQDRSLDVVCSNSFLEHVDDVDAVLTEVARVTAPGGFGVHAIDAKDHESYGPGACGPLDFLRSAGGGMRNGSNRIRIHEFPALFERHGFTVQQLIPEHRTELTDRDVESFAVPWRSMPREQLQILSARLIVRRR